ncbi:MAG: sugar phosphate isomerase/epimerase [Acidobacteriota bacterium]|nr:sugar phosphate isomerase/epimerase [Acidobacteriota bacterium]
MLLSTRRDVLRTSLLLPFAPILSAIPLSQIKLGVTTDEIDEDVKTAAKFLGEYGLKWAEVRSIWGKYNTEQPIDKIREARAIFDEHGIHVSIEGTGFFKVPLPPDNAEGQRKLDEQWILLDGACERAKAFGTDKIRVFGFTYKQGETPDETRDEKIYGRIYELLSEAGRRAKGRGLRLAVENVGGSYISTGAQSAALLKKVKDANVGLTWDPNNAGASGEDAFPGGYRKLDPARIFHVHLRDYKHNPDGKVEWSAVGEGEFDNASQIRSLIKDGYKETFTLETHWKSPKGKAYATATSLKALLQVIGRV